MKFHIIEGEAGCRYAVAHGCVAVIVDALRASATAAMLLHHGAMQVLAVREVEEARAAHHQDPEALLYGERGGLPPEGFHHGNSPREAHAAAGKRVIFTTTTGAGRLVQAWGAEAVYMGSTVNARAVAAAAGRHGREVVLVPAGLMGVQDFDAQEDRVAAVAIAMGSGAELGIGVELFDYWRPRIEVLGLQNLFSSAPHAEKLRAIGQDADIAYCAALDVTEAVPKGITRATYGVVMIDGAVKGE